MANRIAARLVLGTGEEFHLLTLHCLMILLVSKFLLRNSFNPKILQWWQITSTSL